MGKRGRSCQAEFGGKRGCSVRAAKIQREEIKVIYAEALKRGVTTVDASDRETETKKLEVELVGREESSLRRALIKRSERRGGIRAIRFRIGLGNDNRYQNQW